MSGESFIDQIYPDLINNFEVKKAIKRCHGKSTNREASIGYYMDRLERAHSSSTKINFLKFFYYEKYVIKYLPQSYIDFKIRISREQGLGNITYNDDASAAELQRVQQAQRDSLDKWIDYLNDPNSSFPIWFRYYAFQGMLKLGLFNKKTLSFSKRSKDSVCPFAELNTDALNSVYSLILKKLDDDKFSSEEEILTNCINFQKLYTYYIALYEKKRLDGSGKWVKYNLGDDYYDLWKSLQGKNTGWCTVSESICQYQLSCGDFYIYYTSDEHGNYTVPRIAIRMMGTDVIREVRGIDFEQNLESEMVPVVSDFLNNNFSEESILEYKKKVHDMNLLTILVRKSENNEEFSLEELEFLYEFDGSICGFGWERDPRIEDIKQNREKVTDLERFSTDYILEKVRNNINLFKNLPFQMVGYELIVLEALKIDKNVVYYIPKDFRFSNELLFIEALKISSRILRHISPTFSDINKIVLTVISEDLNALRFIPTDLPCYEEIILEALKLDETALSYISRDFRFNDLTVGLKAISYDYRLMRVLSNDLLNNELIINLCNSQNCFNEDTKVY